MIEYSCQYSYKIIVKIITKLLTNILLSIITFKNIMACENVSVNISILYRLCKEERKRRRELGLPYSPYWHTRRLRFTAIFSDFAYRGQTCVCAYIIGLGKKRERRRRRNSSPSFLLQRHQNCCKPIHLFHIDSHIYGNRRPS